MRVLDQALLDEWRAELARKPLGMSEAEACAILEISFDSSDANSGSQQQHTVDEETLKGAYRCESCLRSC